MTDILSRTGVALRRLLHLLARPVRKDRGRSGYSILPYRGYGSAAEVFLVGRVFRQSRATANSNEGGLSRDLHDIVRRLRRRGVPGAVLRARFGGAEKEVSTDRDGYFRISMKPERLPSDERLWREVELELVLPASSASATGEVFIPPRRSRFVVISDIDDTVMLTGVANKMKMVWRLFIQGAQSRVAFPGVTAFYRALHDGSGEGEGAANPILYVSRGPWGLYELLDEFFHLHRIPVGPILFLREWGLSWHRPFPRKARGHKRDLVDRMLAIYPELPFILIGDSGQHDPEIYAQVVRDHPGRVHAVYIRNVTRDSQRVAAIEHLAARLTAEGCPLLLAADSLAMAEHAAEHGLIDSSALEEVAGERRAQQDADAPRRPVREVRRGTPEATEKAVKGGEIGRRLRRAGASDPPPNVAVEPESDERE